MFHPDEEVTGEALYKSLPCLRAKASDHSWAGSEPWPLARSGPTPSPSRRLSRVGDRRERQKKDLQGHFHLHTNENWLLNGGYRNGLLIFGKARMIFPSRKVM